ncbi:type I secretion system permease/ATPase [Aureimonas pseudogalii]|uniref:ATP-binding cassette subfamily C protein n=1 Tax=Aureimonas pseudogalii TaxID=1744844 RepID=A0A7W6H859_9HYPH|nr:type I secretion system permease/ATPase [Aureimonas pseudogalii]MBB4000312.1 ATP-binding cassette subfamily C protein [Aureimonas pseudogalii]
MTPASNGSSSELSAALRSCRGAFIGVGAMSGMLNVLALTGSFYMLQVYDRVIPSRSVSTLIGLSIIVGFLFVFQGVLDALRMRVLSWSAAVVDERVGRRVFDISSQLPLKMRASGDGSQAQRDLDQIRGYLSSVGPTAFFDMPWMPLYLGICFLFHFWIGMLATVGALVLCALTFLTERLTVGPAKEASKAAVERNILSEASRRNAEVLQAMGFAGRVANRWETANARLLGSQRRVGNVAGSLGSASKICRMILQSAILALGAWLVIHGEASGGIMIASSIMMSRALAPVELAIGSWKGFVGARQSWSRLNRLMAAMPERSETLTLPAPKAKLTVEAVSVAPPGEQRLSVTDATFELTAGQALGVIGPSASGKSSLARALVGVWPTLRGKVRLDGAPLDRWSPEALGPHIGYLPQDIELFAGTISENIGRFEESPDASAIIAAAQAAGVHEMILRLSDGYETQVGESGTVLSAGQRQRIALARALYRDPFLVVLDEPNSNLDAEGEAALTEAILSIRARGGIAVVVAHRPSALSGVDHVLAMANGRVQAFGPKEEVLGKVLQRPAVAGGLRVMPSLEGKAS